MDRRLLAVGVAFSLFAAFASGQTPPMAEEFQVNTYTTGDQLMTGLAMDRAGNFAVTWQSFLQEGSENGVFARRYDAGGTAQGTEFQVNAHTTGSQNYPSVAMDPAGGIVVVWDSPQDGDATGIVGRRLDEACAPMGPEFAVNTYTTGYQSGALVAADAGGNFVVLWDSREQDGSWDGVFAQRFDNSGAPAGAEFRVNAYTAQEQVPGGVAMDASGNFVVVWNGYGLGADEISEGVFLKRYNGAGVPLSSDFVVSTFGGSPSVAMDRAGEFVVAWDDGFTPRILAQRFNAFGAPVAAAFQVNTYKGFQALPSVAMDGSGNFIMTWQSKNQGGLEHSVIARRFDRFGTPVTPEFLVSSSPAYLARPRAAISDTGAFVVAWRDFQHDGSYYGVSARRSALSAAGSFAVDAHAAAGAVSNVNGVLEPGETAVVEPAWKNTGAADLAFTGSSPSLTGPGGAAYTLNEDSADYGTVAAGATANCHGATGDCYEVTVSDPPARPIVHWDLQLQENLSAGTPKTWTLHVGRSFTDVPVTQPFYKKIETLLHTGITAGCTATKYCPGDSVSRSQMAIFIAKGIAGSGAAIPSRGKVGASGYDCKAGGASLFADVSPSDIFCKQVHYIASENVTLGCSPTAYCPADTVTRLQMAAFVAKAIVAPQGGAGVPSAYGPDPATGLSYSCDAGSPNVHFSDVPAGDPFCKHVHYLWARGIIAGCSATRYCPGDPVTRDAMAKFLGNAFALELYGP